VYENGRNMACFYSITVYENGRNMACVSIPSPCIKMEETWHVFLFHHSLKKLFVQPIFIHGDGIETHAMFLPF
jgi:hypothetical protein